jgi:hypothetical protein
MHSIFSSSAIAIPSTSSAPIIKSPVTIASTIPTIQTKLAPIFQKQTIVKTTSTPSNPSKPQVIQKKIQKHSNTSTQQAIPKKISTQSKVLIQSNIQTQIKPTIQSTTFQPKVLIQSNISESKVSTSSNTQSNASSQQNRLISKTESSVKSSTVANVEKNKLKPVRTIDNRGSVGQWRVSTRFAKAVDRWIEQRALRGVVSSKTIIPPSKDLEDNRERFWLGIKYDLKKRNMIQNGYHDEEGERNKFHPDGPAVKQQQFTARIIESTADPERMDIQRCMDAVTTQFD